MSKLNQIVAVMNGKKTETERALTELHKKSQKSELFNGMRRYYKPLDDEGETLPPEVKNVQEDANEVLAEAANILGNLIDVVATQDTNNCQAKADVVVDGQVLLSDVPVTHLLFLEKQLIDFHTFVNKLPTLELNERWTWDEQTGEWVSEHYQTNRTQKELKHKVLYEATHEHPAQVEKWTVDAVVGQWDIQKFSTAMPLARKKELASRVKKVQEAVKFARETANNMEVTQVKLADKLFGYLLK